MPETIEKVEPKPIDLGEYKFGFHDDVTPIASTGKGPTEAAVREMSQIKGEPEWMLDFRLKSLNIYNSMDVPNWVPDISGLDMANIVTYVRPKTAMKGEWDEVPEEIKSTFDRLGIPEADLAHPHSQRRARRRALSAPGSQPARTFHIDTVTP